MLMDTYSFRIRDCYRFSKITEDIGLLASGSGTQLLESKSVIQFLEILQKGEVKHAPLEDFGDPVEVSKVILQLENDGIITSDLRTLPNPIAGFWEDLGFDPLKIASRLSSKSVMVFKTGNSNLDGVEPILLDCGFKIETNGKFAFVFASDYLDSELEAMNQEFLERKIPWLIVSPGGTKPLIGPIFLSNQNSPCWLCLRHRLVLNRQDEIYFQSHFPSEGRIPRPEIRHPALFSMALSTAIIEALKWLALDEESELIEHVMELNPFDRKRKLHRLLKRPQCQCCGKKERRAIRPFKIKEFSIVSLDGGYRTAKPEVTFEKFKHHISPITGVVPYVRSYFPIQNAPIFNQVSGNNLALQSKSRFWLNMHLRSANGGKGKTEIQAKVGALCEAIERYSVVYHGDNPGVMGSLDSLENAIHPNECMLFSDKQLAERNEINGQASKFFAMVPVPFDRSKEMEWTKVYSLTDERFHLLPSCFCFAQYPALDETQLYSYPDSNGCAAGNTLGEAALQAVLELIERDAAAIWWYNEIERPWVKLDTVDNDYIKSVIKFYKKINRKIHVLDLTTDLGVPVFVSISYNFRKGEKDRILYAFGAHVDAGIAIERSIIELNQLLPVVEHQNRSAFLSHDKDLHHWLENISIKDYPYLQNGMGNGISIQTYYPSGCNTEIQDALQYCIEKFKKNNLQLMVLDVTQPDIGLPVVRLFAPGLRHFWRRLAPGRLYDVPVKMGWIKETKKESELNPRSIFI